MKTTVGIYKITNPKGAVYIGSSKDVGRRFRQYKRLTEHLQTKLFNSLVKYGVREHTFEIVEECSMEELYERERCWGIRLNVLDRTSGLNCQLPGLGEKTSTMSMETRSKIGAKHKGKKLSQQHIQKIRDRVKGIKQSKEHIEKRKMFGKRNPMFGKMGILAPFWGRHHSTESRKQMSVSRTGRHLLGENSNAKPVINIITRKRYGCAKEVASFERMNYSTLKAKLQGRNFNNTNYVYEMNYGK